jgi:hypothetical protein
VSLLLLIAAVVLGVWAALADAGVVNVGAPPQLLALAVACGFAAFLPWWTRRP